MIRLNFRVNRDDLIRIKNQARLRGLTVSEYIRFLVEKDWQLIRMEQTLARIEETISYMFESITALNDLNIGHRLQKITYLAERINLLGNHLTIETLEDPKSTFTEIHRKMNELSK